MKKSSPNYGGARAGAGKPRADGKGLLDATVLLRLTSAQKAALPTLGGQAYMRQMIDRAPELAALVAELDGADIELSQRAWDCVAEIQASKNSTKILVYTGPKQA